MPGYDNFSRALTCVLAPLALGLTLVACGGDVDDSPDPLALSATPIEAGADPVADLSAGLSAADSTRSDGAPLPELEPGRMASDDGGPERLSELEIDFGDASTGEPSGHAPEPVETITLFVRHGETLVWLADHSGSTAEELAELNHIDVTWPLRAGEPIVVPVDRVDADTVRASRDEVLARRVDRYLRGRGGSLGTEVHRVRTGDTGWSIARDVADVPLWVLAAYNPEADLDRLRIGDSLMVPVLTATLTEAATEPDSSDLDDGRSGLSGP